MLTINHIKLFIPLAFVALISISLISRPSNGQIFDQMLADQNSSTGKANENQVGIRRMLKDVMNVNVPIFYDMVKNGSSMGINVLSGLVKVERGQEAERSGLSGPRPLSVRIFGVPVYERGVRVRPLDSAFSGFSGFGGFGPFGGDGKGGRDEPDGEEVGVVGSGGYEPKVEDNGSAGGAGSEADNEMDSDRLLKKRPTNKKAVTP